MKVTWFLLKRPSYVLSQIRRFEALSARTQMAIQELYESLRGMNRSLELGLMKMVSILKLETAKKREVVGIEKQLWSKHRLEIKTLMLMSRVAYRQRANTLVDPEKRQAGVVLYMYVHGLRR